MRVLVAVLAITLAFAAPAMAGGWAVTTLDELPTFHAGQTYAVGYTIRQHGVTPIDVSQVFGGGTTEIQILGPDGHQAQSFRGVQTGPVGHYVAQVRFPSAGKWSWSVTQGAFAPQQLGTIDVLAAVAPAPAPDGQTAPASQPQAPNALLISALLLAMAGSALLFGTRLATFMDRRATG
jgi:hypothetical protein